MHNEGFQRSRSYKNRPITTNAFWLVYCPMVWELDTETCKHKNMQTLPRVGKQANVAKRGKKCKCCQGWENMQTFPSVRKVQPLAKGGKTCVRCRTQKMCNMCQAQENGQHWLYWNHEAKWALTDTCLSCCFLAPGMEGKHAKQYSTACRWSWRQCYYPEGYPEWIGEVYAVHGGCSGL